ncbi:hypothetical protein ED28_16525 [[Pantoea] beijingensis]|uniref:Fimbrial-type adhesion domain-containing protein n=1 Tax=[Pantoea] beijingensis TaxID=1324864 RepID=A0A443IAH0_9GAMM|nr:fimbrial protein [[Pantoea] beijingensis]RWR01053.1 hypothetical protein ED28_16525 [[Pantoea] beijingensis]
MYIDKKILSFLVLTMININQASAYPEFEKPIFVSIQSIDIAGPVDNMDYGTVVWATGMWTEPLCRSSDVNYTLGSIVYEPIATWTGRTYQATPAHVPIPLFESGVTGFYFSQKGGNARDPAPFNFYPLPTAPTTVWSGYIENAARVEKGFGMVSGMNLYKDEHRIDGVNIIPVKRMYRYLCKDDRGATQEIYNYVTRPIYINSIVRGCTPDKGAVILDMDKIAQGTVENADPSTLLGTKQSTFSLKCDPDVRVYMSIVDLSDTKNISDTASLTPDSTATGVGFAVTSENGTRLRFGPDGSAANVPGQQKYYLQYSGTIPSKDNIVNARFGFSYVRKPEQEVKAGTAKAVIGITYSYQ